MQCVAVTAVLGLISVAPQSHRPSSRNCHGQDRADFVSPSPTVTTISMQGVSCRVRFIHVGFSLTSWLYGVVQSRNDKLKALISNIEIENYGIR